jgi:adenine-specific DNA-methyltransferase
MQGNNYQIDKEPLLAIPYFLPSVAEQERIATLVQRLIDCKRKMAAVRSAAEEQQLSRVMNQCEAKIQESIELSYGLSAGESAALAT